MDRRCRCHRSPDPRFLILAVVLAIMAAFILLA
jgi:hypothetical protein